MAKPIPIAINILTGITAFMAGAMYVYNYHEEQEEQRWYKPSHSEQ